MKFANIDYFIRSKYKVEPYKYRKAKLLVETSLLTSAFSGFYFLQTNYLDMHYAQLAMLYNVISFLLIPFFFKWGMSSSWAANLYIFTGFVGVGVCVLVQNILETSTIIWFALLPVVSLMLSNKLNAWVWTIIACIVVVVFGIIHQTKFLVIDEAPADYNTILEVSNISGFILIVYLVVMVFQKTTDDTLKIVDEKNMTLEEVIRSLKSTQAQLIQSEKMASLGELTAGIAHEIQNPLNFVNNFSDVNSELIRDLVKEAESGNMDEIKLIANDIRENEQKINHHGKRAEAIVNGMLQHSLVSTGKKESTDINALALENLRLSYHGLKAKDKSFYATFNTELDSTLPIIKVVQPDIARALLNLFNNAFYAVNEKRKAAYSPSQTKVEILPQVYEPTVTVSTSLNPPSGARGALVLISVRDNGNGVPEKLLEKIFQPFFTTKPTGQGTGLGLSLTYDIIKAHGGELKVQTKQGEYAEFTIELPVEDKNQISG